MFLQLIHRQVNTFLCVAIGFSIDKWGGPLLSVILATFHMGGAIVMAGAATNHLNSYPLLILGKVIAAVGDGSLDNAQHRIFSTYFARGGGFAFSIGMCHSELLDTTHSFQGSRCNLGHCKPGPVHWTINR